MATPSIESAEPAPAPLPEGRAWPAWEVAALVTVSLLGLVLRFHGYDQAPLLTDNADELNFAFGGLNLITIHDAYTWSYLHAYPAHTTLTAYGTTFPMVHHWFDHPPLFSLLIGGWLWLLGVRDILSISALELRVLPVLFSATTIPLVHLLGRRFVGRQAAIIGTALLATSPGAVLLGRITEAESILAVLLLVGLLLTARVVDGEAGWVTIVALLAICLVSPLFKVTAIAIAGICGVILVVSGRWRLAAALGGCALGGLALYALWGALVDWGLFVRVWSEQASRRVGVMSAWELIAAPAGNNRELRDGWWLLGWIGLGAIAARGRRRWDLFLAWPAVAYAATMVVLATETQVAQYGWYRVFVYPEVYLAAGWVAWEAVTRRSLTLIALLLALGGTTSVNWWLGTATTGWVPNPLVLAVIAALVVGPTVVALWRRDDMVLRRRAGWAVGAALGVMLLGNTIESLLLNDIFFRM